MRLKKYVRAVTKEITVDLDTGTIVKEEYSNFEFPKMEKKPEKEINLPTIEDGEFSFINQKKATIKLSKKFNAPKIVLVMKSNSVLNPFVSGVKKDEFTINFTANFTGLVGWIAIEQQ